MGNTIIQGVLVRMKAHARLQCACPLGKGLENKCCQVRTAVWDQPWSVYSLTLKDKVGRVGLAQGSLRRVGKHPEGSKLRLDLLLSWDHCGMRYSEEPFLRPRICLPHFGSSSGERGSSSKSVFGKHSFSLPECSPKTRVGGDLEAP